MRDTPTRAPADDFRTAILAALGHAPEHIEPGRWQRFATTAKRGDLSGWCLLFDDGRAGIYGCWRAGLSAVWTATDRRRMSQSAKAELAQQVAAAKAKRKAEQGAKWKTAARAQAELWSECQRVPADGSGADPLTLYLRRRLALTAGEPLAVPAALRLHPGLPYWHDGTMVGRWPAMVAMLQAPCGAVMALHRTWLTLDGRKAPVPGPVKKLTPACGPVLGGCIRLFDTPAPCTGRMPPMAEIGVAEGIETALACREISRRYGNAELPFVAAYSAGALAAWQWPTGTQRIVIGADADPAGAEAAQELKRRALRAGVPRVDVSAPSVPGADWADLWSRRDGAAATNGTGGRND